MATVAVQASPCSPTFDMAGSSFSQRFYEAYFREQLYSAELNMEEYDLEELAVGLPLRKHHDEAAAQKGTDELQDDWRQMIGPIKASGCANLVKGHCCALMFPFCKPERLQHTSYITEFALLYDTVLESVQAAASSDISNNFATEHSESLSDASKRGVKAIREKIVAGLLDLDKKHAGRVIDGWQEMVATVATLDKTKMIGSLKEYVDFRVIDSGAPFLTGLMCWGMGMSMTKEEEEYLAPAVYSAFAAIALGNDVLSYDFEKFEFDASDKTVLQNSVWYNMQWHNMTIEEAKEKGSQQTLFWVNDFLQTKDILLAHANPASMNVVNIQRYLDGLTHMLSGCMVWEQECPRYDIAWLL